MDNLNRSTIDDNNKEDKIKYPRFELFLIEYSEIAFIYAAIPTFMKAVIGVITGILLFVHKSQYDDCKKSNDMLFGFLLGQMIFFYYFALVYANLILQLIPYLDRLTIAFGLFISYFFLNTGWTLWGINVLITTGCKNSVYYGIAAFTIAFALSVDLILLIGFIVLFVKKRKTNSVTNIDIKRNSKNNMLEKYNSEAMNLSESSRIISPS